MFSFCLFAISLFISFALSCNLPNVIYYSTTYKQGMSLFNENYYPVGYYNKIVNNSYKNYRHVLLFDTNTFYYYFSFYMMYVIYKLTTKILLGLLTCHKNYDASKLLNSVIRKRTGINMNDTYYIPEEEGEEEEGREDGEEGEEEEGEGREDGSSCGEDCEEVRVYNDEPLEEENDGDKGEGDGEEEGEEDGEDSCNDGGCGECNNENCTYFSIDNQCKIRCVKTLNI